MSGTLTIALYVSFTTGLCPWWHHEIQWWVIFNLILVLDWLHRTWKMLIS